MKLIAALVGSVCITGIALVTVLTINHLIESGASQTTLITTTALFTTAINGSIALIVEAMKGGKD